MTLTAERLFRRGLTNHRGTEGTEEGHRGVGGTTSRAPLNRRHKLTMSTPSLKPSESRQPPSTPTEPSVFITLWPLCLCGSFFAAPKSPQPSPSHSRVTP